MTDIETKALALLNEVLAERVHWQMTGTRAENASLEALCRAIEQHEATKQELADFKQELSDFRQEVSDAVWDYYGGKHIPRTSMFAKFAIPKPDPLVAVLEKMGWYIAPNGPTDAENFRKALDALGFEIREKSK